MNAEDFCECLRYVVNLEKIAYSPNDVCSSLTLSLKTRLENTHSTNINPDFNQEKLEEDISDFVDLAITQRGVMHLCNALAYKNASIFNIKNFIKSLEHFDASTNLVQLYIMVENIRRTDEAIQHTIQLTICILSAYELDAPEVCNPITPYDFPKEVWGKMWTVAQINNKAVFVCTQYTTQGRPCLVIGIDTVLNSTNGALHILKDEKNNFTWTGNNSIRLIPPLDLEYLHLETNPKMSPNDTRIILKKKTEDMLNSVRPHESTKIFNYKNMWEIARKTDDKRYICWFGTYVSKEDLDDENTINFY